MASVIPCPDRRDLNRLASGQLALAEVELLASHLEGCEACARTVEGLGVEDSLAELLRAHGEMAERPEDTAVRLLRERIHSLRGEVTAAAEETSSGPAPDDDCYDFLAPPAGPDELGRLGEYRVLKVLGQGGMGAVFLAEDPRLRRQVALKVMRPALASSSSARQRFVREAQAQAAIEHDHIITIYQVSEDRGVPFLAMPLLRGMSLESWLRKEPRPSLAEVLRIGRQVALGLAAAHDRGLIHRDIKPSNLWLEAPSGRVKILDFGLAHTGEGQGQLTQSGVIVGTPAYMAPEQARGERVDGRADLFSLGCVLYRLCTGQTPFTGPSTLAILNSLALETPKPVRDLNPAIPAALSDLIDRLLAKDAAGRPATARDVIEALQDIEAVAPGDQGAATWLAERPQPVGERLQGARGRQTAQGPAAAPPPRKRWLLIAAACLAPLLLLAGWVIVRDRQGNMVAEVGISDGGSAEVRPDRDGKAPEEDAPGEEKPAALPAPLTGQEIDLLAAVEPARVSSNTMRWERKGADLVGTGIAPGSVKGWPEITFPPVVTGDYDAELDLVQKGFFPLQLDLPLGDRAIRVTLNPIGSGLLLIDGKDGRRVPLPCRNIDARLQANVPQKLIARVRQRGEEVEVLVLLEGVRVGHFIGSRRRISLPHWVPPDRQHLRVSGLTDLSSASLTFTRARVVQAPQGPAGAAPTDPPPEQPGP